jgi:hypothetical protein
LPVGGRTPAALAPTERDAVDGRDQVAVTQRAVGCAWTSTPAPVQAQVRGGTWVPSLGVTSRSTTNAAPTARMKATSQPTQ